MIEADLIRMCTCEGMKVAKAKGNLRGEQPKLNTRAHRSPETPHRNRVTLVNASIRQCAAHVRTSYCD